MNYIVLVLLLLTSCASQGPAQIVAVREPAEYSIHSLPPPSGGSVQELQLKVTTWNVRKLGRKTFEADDRLFKILNDTDVIAFQEVNASKGTGKEALRLLRDGMAAVTGRKLCYALTNPPSGERLEVYGFIWRNDRLARVQTDGKINYDCETTADEVPLAIKVADLIVREPAIVDFVFKPNARVFRLISVHLVPQAKESSSPRNPEMEVEPLFSVTKDSSLPTLVVGDFNLGPLETAAHGDPFVFARELGFSASLIGVRTSLQRKKKDFSKEFDNLWIRGFNLEGIDRINIFDKFPEKSPQEIIRTLSDHAPVTGAYTFQ